MNRADPAQEGPTLNGLRLTGLIWDPKQAEQIRALVETTDGLGYILRLNDQRFVDKVVAIAPDPPRFSGVDQTAAGQPRIQLLGPEARQHRADPRPDRGLTVSPK